MRPQILCRLAAMFASIFTVPWLLRLSIVLLLVVSAGGPPAALQAAPAPATGISPADPVPAPNQPAVALRYFDDSGHTLQGGFREFWESGQGPTLLGLPLTEEFAEQYTDGATATVQYFERGVLEYHPDAPAGHRVTLRNVGTALLGGRRFPMPTQPDGQVFPATGFAVGGEFLRFWRAMDGAATFGNPLSPPVLEDGRTVQYFERARFESHPEFVGQPYQVALSPLGYEDLRAAGYSAPLGALVELNPPSVAEGYTMQVRVAVPQGGKTSGKLDGVALTFVHAGATEMRAVAGAAAMGAVGTHRLTLTISDAQGRSRTVTRPVQVTPWSYPVDRLTLDDETSGLLDPDIVNGELNQLAKIYAGRSGGPLWSGPFRAPLAGSLTVNAPFGERRAYNGGPVSTFHAGVDLRAAMGTPVLAAAAGHVVLAARLQVRGNAIIIDHGMGVFTLYAHLSAFKVKKGDTVKAGQVIGLSGNTGLSTGAHLHWEMHVSGPAVNPFEWTHRAFP